MREISKLATMGKLIFVAIFMVFVVIAEFASSEVAAGAAVMVGSSGTKEEGDNKLVQEEEGDIDGGFSSLDGMLTWAIGTFIYYYYSP